MIKIAVYTNGVKIRGHADINTCSMVSMTHTILTNNLICFVDVEYYTSELDEDITKRQDGYSEVKFKLTKTTKLLIDEYYRQIKDYIDYKFFPNTQLVSMIKYDEKIKLERYEESD